MIAHSLQGYCFKDIDFKIKALFESSIDSIVKCISKY